jgi:transcriptional regulator with XRE-family HTH domain
MSKKTKTTEKPDDPPAIVGARLRLLRNTADLTILDFVKLSGISHPSISYWENGRLGHPIKPKSLKKIRDGFQKIGLEVTGNWLLKGELPIPTYKDILIPWEPSHPKLDTIAETPAPENKLPVDTHLATVFADEMKLFDRLEQSIMTKVDHAYLKPFLDRGDFVGGIWQSPEDLTEPTICIFRIDNNLHIGCLKKRKKKNYFDIFYPKNKIAPEPSVPELKNVQLDKVAPVTRVWRLSL